jgi:chromosome segregation ATPase
MSEIKKLTTEEIDLIKSLQKQYNKVVFDLGSIESQLLLIKKEINILEAEKSNIVKDMEKIGESEKSLIDSLQTKYGAGNINIETGEITPF